MSARVNEGCELFVASLEKAQAELEWVANRLEGEFSTRYRAGKVNPYSLLSRIHGIQRELPSLISECNEVMEAKREYVDTLKGQLQENCGMIEKLSSLASLEVDEKSKQARVMFEDGLNDFDNVMNKYQHRVGSKE
jgi:hypothetical protein